MLIFGLAGWPVAVAVAVAVADGFTGFVFFGAKIFVSTLSSNVTDRDSRPWGKCYKTFFTAVIYDPLIKIPCLVKKKNTHF